MEYKTVSEAAAQMGITARRLQQMCKDGEIAGAFKKGRSWMIPSVKESQSYFPSERKTLPIGISDYKMAESDYYYVDKTLLIRDFLDQKPMVSLFTRPRRFGKTLNMDMLRVFFEKTDEDTSVYFQNRKIWQCGEAYTSYQGQYPVIFVSFKDVKCISWEESILKISRLLSLEYQRHIELENSEFLNYYEKEQYRKIANGKADEMDYEMSLQMLSLLLHKHYGRKAIIIIDDYDTPIQQGHACGFYNSSIQFMRNFFSGGLKDNPHLA